MQDEAEQILSFLGWRIVDPPASHPRQALPTGEILTQQGAGSGGGGCLRSCGTPSLLFPHSTPVAPARPNGGGSLGGSSEGAIGVSTSTPPPSGSDIAAEADLSLYEDTLRKYMTPKEFVQFPPAVMPKRLGHLWREAWKARCHYVHAPVLFRCTTADAKEAAAKIFHTTFFGEAMQTQNLSEAQTWRRDDEFPDYSPADEKFLKALSARRANEQHPVAESPARPNGGGGLGGSGERRRRARMGGGGLGWSGERARD